MNYHKEARRLALIVEDVSDLRSVVVSLFAETDLEIAECENAEAALAVLLLRGSEAALIFADIQLSGSMDGVDLAREAKMRWPHLGIILTSGNAGDRINHLPPGVVYMPKPWKGRDVLIAAEQAKSSAQARTIYGR